MDATETVVPVDKYKGQPLSALVAVKRYCEWLRSREWTRDEKYHGTAVYNPHWQISKHLWQERCKNAAMHICAAEHIMHVSKGHMNGKGHACSHRPSTGTKASVTPQSMDPAGWCLAICWSQREHAYTVTKGHQLAYTS
ncbi:hypothetical protein JKP88DRAFT_267893, partial [Tribonema minus]